MSMENSIARVYPRLRELFPPGELEAFLATEPEALERWNYEGLGTMIRLRLLGTRSLLRRDFLAEGICSGDQMTMLVITQFHRYLCQLESEEQALEEMQQQETASL